MKRLILAALAAILLAWAGWRAAKAYLSERQAFHPETGPVPLPSPPLEGLRAVEFGAGVRGWWFEARNGAALVFLHGSNADRTQLLPEARFLVARGFGALVYDSPGHAESAGRAQWGAPERAALRSAVAFAAAQKGVKAVGALGFSMGAFVLAQAAPSEPALAASVLESCFTDSDEFTRWEYRNPVRQWLAFLAQRQVGFSPAAGEQPLARIGQFAPRPILLISGMDDSAVTPAMARELFAAARSPRELWLVPGAGHGHFAAAAPDYFERLETFYRTALSAP